MTVIDQIRAILKSRSAISREMLEPLVDEYSEQVARVNERLQRCEGLLRKGLRSEALQLADLEPRLLDQVALLDFPELEDWEEILRFYGIEVPTSLLLDVALQLQDAMVNEQPLEAVLKQHRRLAIARAPLSWRLRVLRQIVQLDPVNPNWPEDIEAWEKVRLKELDREVDDAIQRKDLESCEKIRQEIESERWAIRPPEALRKRLDERIRSMRTAETFAALETLAADLNAAFCEMDSQRGKMLAQQWQKTASSVQQVPAGIWQVAEPALAWIEEMEKELARRFDHEAISERLRESLNDRAKVTEVMRLHQSLMRMDLGIEPSLERLYQSFLENRKLESLRRTRLVMAGLVGGLMIVAALIGVFLWQRADKNQELTIAAQLQSLIDAKQFEEAGSFINQMNANSTEMMKRPSVTKLVEEVNQWKLQEEDRLKQFEDYVARADHEEDAKIDLNAVVQAERLARSETEKGKAFALRKRHTEWELQVAQKQRQDAERELNSITAKIKNIEAMEALDIDLDTLSGLKKELGDVVINYPKCGELVRGEVDLAEKNLDDLRRSVSEIKSRMQMGERLALEIRDATSTDKLEAALKDFNDRVAGVPLNADFDAALADKEAWGIADKWNSWSTSYAEFLKGASGKEEAIRLATEWDDEIRDIQGLPPSVVLPQLSDELKLLAERSDILEAYRTSVADSMWSGVGTVVVDSENARIRRFTYASKEKDINKKSADFAEGKTVGIEVIVEGDGTYGNWSPNGAFEYVPEPHLSVESLLVELEKKSSSFERNWEREWLGQMAKFVKDPRIDVMVKEELLLGMLEAMQPGSISLKPECEELIQVLKGRKRERENWFGLLEYKTSVEDTLTQRLQESFKKIVERDKLFSRIAATRIGYMGCVLPLKSDGTDPPASAVIINQPEALPALSTALPKCLFAMNTPPENAELVYFFKDGMKLSCGTVGSIRSGEVLLRGDSFRLVPCGTPIFAINQ